MVLPVAGQNTSPFTDYLRRNKSCDRYPTIIDLKILWLKITCSVSSNNGIIYLWSQGYSLYRKTFIPSTKSGCLLAYHKYCIIS